MKHEYARACMAIVYHVGKGRDMCKEAQTATGLALMNNVEGLRRLVEKLEALPD